VKSKIKTAKFQREQEKFICALCAYLIHKLMRMCACVCVCVRDVGGWCSDIWLERGYFPFGALEANVTT